MFSGNDLNKPYWYINRWTGSSFEVSYVDNTGNAAGYSAAYNWFCVRPVLVLKSNIKVTGGEGTPNSPYVLNI